MMKAKDWLVLLQDAVHSRGQCGGLVDSLALVQLEARLLYVQADLTR